MRSTLHRWPAALGLLAAGFQIVTGANRESVAITVVVATLCYLAAAAFNRPWIAWATIAGGSVIVVAGELAGLTWWVAVGLVAAGLAVIGLVTGVPRPALTAQTGALLGFGALAVTALYLDPRAGMILAGLALAAHSGWDVIHYRRNTVVPRSMAEFCMVLDLPLGAALIVLAFTS
ncbi:hypothetical protein [Actinoplanes sp. NPDC089786]|uniref:hypothetical protein n=1 Tax=Actinoplanes sp. NPDC089786 TaxID=3155185 RepID=UPI003438AC79